MLTKLGIADVYTGNEEAAKPAEDGGLYHVQEAEEGPRPFRCFLDVGLARTSTGAKVFGVMKGAVDGGVDVPHNEKRFPGYTKETPTDYVEVLFWRGGGLYVFVCAKYCHVQMLEKYVTGQHVSEFMEELQEDDEDRYKKQFSAYIKEGITADKMEDMYREAHEAIRANPMIEKAQKPEIVNPKKYHKSKLSYTQRKDRLRQRKANYLARIKASAAE